MKQVLVLFLTLFLPLYIFGQTTTQNIVLVTLDGMRWQEVFGGAVDSLINNSKYTENSQYIIKTFYDEDHTIRREKLMPFFWKVISKEGQLYGNRWMQSNMDVANDQWFSYPGYNEILIGAPNPNIRSNKKMYNPNITILEWLAKHKEFKSSVAAFCSWDVFPYILNDIRCGFPVNAGFDTVRTANLSPKEHFLNELMSQIPSPFSSVRLDAFTFHYAFEYMKREKPRMLYIALGETDDFAHLGQYDHYLQSAYNSDQWIEKLWKYIQSDAQYKDKTTLIITTDHGRGVKPIDKWTDHGSDVEGSSETWCAVIGPDTPPLGEVSGNEHIFASQISPTIAKFFGLKYRSSLNNAGQPISSMIK